MMGKINMVMTMVCNVSDRFHELFYLILQREKLIARRKVIIAVVLDGEIQFEFCFLFELCSSFPVAGVLAIVVLVTKCGPTSLLGSL